MPTTNSADASSREEPAEELVRASIYRTTATHPARTVLASGATSASGNCGLGERAAVVLDLSPRGREIFDRLFPGAGEAVCARVHACTREWVEAQDAIDRKRNHFLKAFRGAHGDDRTRYSTVQLAELDVGLARGAHEEIRERRAAAERLLGS
jgi:hypothetical protein